MKGKFAYVFKIYLAKISNKMLGLGCKNWVQFRKHKPLLYNIGIDRREDSKTVPTLSLSSSKAQKLVHRVGHNFQ